MQPQSGLFVMPRHEARSALRDQGGIGPGDESPEGEAQGSRDAVLSGTNKEYDADQL